MNYIFSFEAVCLVLDDCMNIKLNHFHLMITSEPKTGFKTMVVSILLYGCTTRRIKCMEKKLNENDMRMLHAVLNKS